jgi:hypothetical protein
MTDRGRDSAVRACLRKAPATLALRHALKWAAAWLFFWGLAVLVLRAAFGADALPLLWGLTALALILAAALVAAVRRRPSAASAYALVDRVFSCGGLVMASSEATLGAWESQVPPLRAPALRWRDRRTPVLFAAACVFAGASFAVPRWFVAAAAGNPLRVEKEVAALKEQIEALKEEKILPPEQAAEMEERLRQTAEAASGEDPAKTWEALDHRQGGPRIGRGGAARGRKTRASRGAGRRPRQRRLEARFRRPRRRDEGTGQDGRQGGRRKRCPEGGPLQEA